MQHTASAPNSRASRTATIVTALGVALIAQVVLMTAGGAGSLLAGVPDLATQLGVSAAAAAKLMDVLGSWYFTVLIAALTGGWGAGLVRIAVSMAAKYGRKYAIAW